MRSLARFTLSMAATLLPLGPVVSCSSAAEEPLVSAAPTSTTAPATPESTTTVPAASDQTAAFLSALALRDSTLLAATAAGLSPGSPAQLYADHLSLAVAALGGSETASLTEVDGVFEVCASERCSSFSDPIFDAGTGLLADIAVDGQLLLDRIGGPGPVAALEEAQARIHSAYRSDNGTVNMIIEVTNIGTQPLRMLSFAAIQSRSDGIVIQPSGAWGDVEVDVGSTGRALVTFVDGDLSAPVSIPVILGDSTDLEFVVPAVS